MTTGDLIVEAILRSVEERGFPPSVRELCDELGLSSPSTVHHHLHRLVRQGRITLVPGSPRTLRVVA